jgi:hypothetical protein
MMNNQPRGYDPTDESMMSGYVRLARAVLTRAVLDASSRSRTIHVPARRWLKRDGLELSDMLGLNTAALQAWIHKMNL